MRRLKERALARGKDLQTFCTDTDMKNSATATVIQLDLRCPFCHAASGHLCAYALPRTLHLFYFQR